MTVLTRALKELLAAEGLITLEAVGARWRLAGAHCSKVVPVDRLLLLLLGLLLLFVFLFFLNRWSTPAKNKKL